MKRNKLFAIIVAVVLSLNLMACGDDSKVSCHADLAGGTVTCESNKLSDALESE